MKDMNVSTVVPAGTFITCNARTDYFMYPKYSSPDIKNPRKMHKKYAKNVGLVHETLAIYAYSSATVERQLIRYHVN